MGTLQLAALQKLAYSGYFLPIAYPSFNVFPFSTLLNFQTFALGDLKIATPTPYFFILLPIWSPAWSSMCHLFKLYIIHTLGHALLHSRRLEQNTTRQKCVKNKISLKLTLRLTHICYVCFNYALRWCRMHTSIDGAGGSWSWSRSCPGNTSLVRSSWKFPFSF